MSDRVSDRVPRVSVLMTIYNAAPYLRQSLDSLLGQTFEDWELIAIENGSSDSSPGILASYKDPRIGVFAVATNMGRTGGLRYAFKRARGKYIAVLDADDLSHRERLAAQVVRLDAEPDLGLLGTWAEVIDGAGVRLRAWEPPVGTAELHDRLGWENPIVHSSAMYRRALAEAAGGYPRGVCGGAGFRAHPRACRTGAHRHDRPPPVQHPRGVDQRHAVESDTAGRL